MPWRARLVRVAFIAFTAAYSLSVTPVFLHMANVLPRFLLVDRARC
jgi:hypothetical protein